ncbi:uncharacterized protein (DUF58 family) [Paenibacillus mucilaginosus]|uniref:DUF58 domain-containing protein n=1 Tax=Paenibacillus mucilaginosus TaxID=61624 RepID=UPI003D1D8DBE
MNSQGLDPSLLLRLERLVLATKQRTRGTVQGKRRSRQMGASLEFADYRQYSPGDDTRRLDWNTYARTGRPFIKQFMDEQELQVNLYLDCSRSMDFGSTGGMTKLEYAGLLAACVGYVGLAGYDRVGVRLFSSRIVKELPLLRGRGNAHRLFTFLNDIPVERTGDLTAALREPLSLPRQPGMTWIFSDFLYEEGIEETLQYFQAAKQELVVVQVLNPDELHPQLSGDLRLVDSELGTGKEVAVSGRTLQAYLKTVREFTQGLQSFCHERGIAYMLARTDRDAAETVNRTMRENGLLS